jgi:hypothetical protein
MTTCVAQVETLFFEPNWKEFTVVVLLQKCNFKIILLVSHTEISNKPKVETVFAKIAR